MSVTHVVQEYYETLRQGDSLGQYFHEEATVKFGVSESLYGYDEIADALREQRETTAEWSVESERLRVDDRGEFAVFADEVRLGWTDTTTGERYSFRTRWSGTLVRERSEWRFVSMHVSAPQKL